MSNTPSFDELWPIVKPHTLLHRHKARMLHSLVEAAPSGYPVAECGVFRGGMTLMLALQMKARQDRHSVVWAFDSFKGLPADRVAAETCYYQTGDMAASYREVRDLLVKHEVMLSHVELCEGQFETTLNDSLPMFGLVHVDCDLYSSAKTCIERLYDHLVVGGIMVFDDYFDLGGGVAKAVNEQLEKTHEVLYAGPIEQVFFIKGRHECDDPSTYIGWQPPKPEKMVMVNRQSQNRFINVSAIVNDRRYLDDLDSGEAVPDLPGKNVWASKHYASRLLDVCDYHQLVLRSRLP